LAHVLQKPDPNSRPMDEYRPPKGENRETGDCFLKLPSGSDSDY
jgi:hypothetical protein